MSETEKKQYGLSEVDGLDEAQIRARIEKRNKEKAERKRKARNRRITVLSIFVAVIGLTIFSFSSFFDVDHIAVEGNSHFTAEEVINMAHATPGKNLLYHPDKAGIVDYLEQNPYIKNASVSRRLPSTLVINVTERKEIGAIIYDDDYLVIDNSGILLKKTQTEPKVSLIEGLVIKKIELGEVIKTEDDELFKQTLSVLNSAKKNDLYFVRLDMSEMYIKAYVYNYLICKGTYKQLLDGIEAGKLHTVLNKLFDEGIKRGTITFSDEGYVSFNPEF